MMICSPDDLLGQEAHTIWYNEKTRSDTILWPLSLVKVKITTGRMHQIRVHFAHAGYPILGDIVYGNPSHNRKLQQSYGFLRQLLHCHCYSFTDMNWKKISFEAPLIDDMKKVIKE
jgi:23S rRNA pseudouridine955/2504/2580 synthase